MTEKKHLYHEIQPGDVWKWKYLEEQIEQVFELFNYQEIRLSILQDYSTLYKGITALLDRDGVPQVTEQVLSLHQPDEDISLLSLRPEGTISVLNQVSKHFEPGKICRFYYHGPMFRKTRDNEPREFYQLGVELLGSDSILSENEVISLGMRLCRQLGLTDAWVELNSFGCDVCRPSFLIAMRNYLEEHKDDYCKECFEALHTDPMRVDKCLSESCAHHHNQGPRIQDYLCDNCKANFDRVKKIQANLANDYKVNPYLFQNFSYYNETVFNFMINTSKGQLMLGGGGRYDFLSNRVTGKQIPAVGFYLNLDTLFQLMVERSLFMLPESRFCVYVCSQSPELEIMILQVVQELHQHGFSTIISSDVLETEEEVVNATKLECQVMVILRSENIREGKVLLRNLVKDKQEYVMLSDLLPEIQLIKKALV